MSSFPYKNATLFAQIAVCLNLLRFRITFFLIYPRLNLQNQRALFGAILTGFHGNRIDICVHIFASFLDENRLARLLMTSRMINTTDGYPKNRSKNKEIENVAEKSFIKQNFIQLNCKSCALCCVIHAKISIGYCFKIITNWSVWFELCGERATKSESVSISASVL